ncbi:NB-ARC domain-containing protein [Calothrix sp. NIES-2100]|uniref:NB-ARC domain-containing protein n=1 Tax=Calothrix sp. NIES-2100 TaxID=1954172 RepID=UPI000B5F15DC|nr:NB-ARC domain-containing protein [Calothrix sp. NIES-2100]
MPRITYGAEPKKRVKRLLEALLCFATGEFAEGKFKIEHDWKEEDSANPKLTIKTTLVGLEALTCAVRNPTPNPSPQARRGKREVEKAKREIREALNLLKNFVKILEDNRIQTQGSDDWHFTLKLWSRDKEKNLKQFDEVWESNKPNKSKELEANFTEDEGIAVVPQTKLTIFQAPPLPTHFVERPEYSDDLKTRLLTEDNRTLVITAIHGLGSVGKSTLAAALAVDAEIQTRFCDGILWATLGQQPDVLSLISGWVQALGDYSFKPTSIEATSTHLRTLLYDKAVLLVVDDAWNTQDAQAFNVGGVRCQVVVTTREAAIADALAASTYSLDIMTPTQAMALLTKKLRREITGAESKSAKNLAKGVGYLPLALELAAAQVADGTAWKVLLQDIQREIARLKTFDRPGARDTTDEASLKRLSLTASLNLSIKRLPEEEREYFTWLGVLPEDVTITPKMTATLWDLADDRDASEALEYLRSKALLLLGVKLADGTLTYRLHDLFHDLARNLLTAPATPKRRGDLPGLGISLVNAHAALLEKYRQKTQNNLWHTLPNDDYIYQHLVWHLEKAEQIEQIHSLLREESATGNNGWYEVREQLAQTGGYITDISRAWELAQANSTESTLGLQYRYVLITASLNSLAANLPINLLMALVKKKKWTPEQGLAYALQKPEPQEKVKSLTVLVNYLPPNLQELALQKALAAARTIQSEKYHADALSALADKLPLDLLPQALAAAKAIQSEKYRAEVLFGLANKLPSDLLPQVLEAASVIEDEEYRTLTLFGLADKLPPEFLPQALEVARRIEDQRYYALALSTLTDKLPSVLPQALKAVRAIWYEEYRAEILGILANKLPPEFLPQVLDAARAIQDEFYRVKVLSVLVEKMPELLPEKLTAARAIKDEYDRAEVLSTLSDELLPEFLPQVLEEATAIDDEFYRAKVLIALADKLPLELLSQLLEAAKAIQDEFYCAYAVSGLAAKLPPELLPQLLEAVRKIQDEYYRACALRALSDQLPSEFLSQVLEAAKSIESKSNHANLLISLADKLPPELLSQVVELATTIQDEFYRTKVLIALSDQLPLELLLKLLEAARLIQDKSDQAEALIALADKLPADLLAEALAAARAIQSEWDHANFVIALADKVPPELLPEVLAAARAIQDEYSRVYALSALAEKLPPELSPEAFAAARAIQSKSPRVYTLSDLAGKLPPELLPEILAAARVIPQEDFLADALSALADKLPPELLPEALAAARAIKSEDSRAKALSALADKLPDILPEAFAAARAIKSEDSRAKALSALADKQLPPELLPEALAAARALQDESAHADALRALADKLPDILPEALAAAKAIQDESAHADALRALADKLPDILPEALAAARAIQDEDSRAKALRALADKLPDILPEALAAARAIQDEDSRAKALSALADSLSQMPSTKLLPLWQNTLYELSLRTRPVVLQDIKALFPVIFALGGEVATAEVARAIADVARWWK